MGIGPPACSACATVVGKSGGRGGVCAGGPGRSMQDLGAARGAGCAPHAAERRPCDQRAEAIVMSRPLRSTVTDVVERRKATNDSGSEALNTPLMVRLASVESAT